MGRFGPRAEVNKKRKQDEDDGFVAPIVYYVFDILYHEGRLLIDIVESLRMLYKEPEHYGRCTNCSQEILFERLDLVPWAKLCVECQREFEARPVPIESGEAA